MPRIFLSFFLLLIAITGRSQLSVGGGVMRGIVADASIRTPMDGVTVTNTTRNRTVFSDARGHYVIEAGADDKIAFTYIGYTAVLIPAVTVADHDVSLQRRSQYLPETIVRPDWTPYQADSISRARTYQRPLARQRSGGVMSPVTFLAERFSKRSRQIFTFQEEFHHFEDQRYVESRYTAELVTKLTGLRGDSVATFINANPMPPEYARAVGELELKMWIRTTFREWMVKLKETAPVTDTVQTAAR